MNKTVVQRATFGGYHAEVVYHPDVFGDLVLRITHIRTGVSGTGETPYLEGEEGFFEIERGTYAQMCRWARAWGVSEDNLGDGA